MSKKPFSIPRPNRPISITPTGGRVTVTVSGIRCRVGDQANYGGVGANQRIPCPVDEDNEFVAAVYGAETK
jgi:hypothetical protein